MTWYSNYEYWYKFTKPKEELQMEEKKNILKNQRIGREQLSGPIEFVFIRILT